MTGSSRETEWLVPKVRDGSALLVSHYAPDMRAATKDKCEFSHWSRSPMREWLNSDFPATAFTPAQTAAIRVTYVSNAAQEFGPEGSSSYKDTSDKVFLLSVKDVFKRYFTSDAQRRAGCVPAVTYRGAVTEAGSSCRWLRCNSAS